MTSTLLITLLCCIGGPIVASGLAMFGHLGLALVVDIFGRLFDRGDTQ